MLGGHILKQESKCCTPTLNNLTTCMSCRTYSPLMEIGLILQQELEAEPLTTRYLYPPTQSNQSHQFHLLSRPLPTMLIFPVLIRPLQNQQGKTEDILKHMEDIGL